MKKFLVALAVTLLVFVLTFAAGFEDNKEKLLEIHINYVDGTNIIISKTYEYETYYKHIHYIYDEDGVPRECEPSYIGKDFFGQGGECPID